MNESTEVAGPSYQDIACSPVKFGNRSGHIKLGNTELELFEKNNKLKYNLQQEMKKLIDIETQN